MIENAEVFGYSMGAGIAVPGHLLVGQRAIDVGRAPIGLLLDGDDLPGLGKLQDLKRNWVLL